jgi:hypothetical protein
MYIMKKFLTLLKAKKKIVIPAFVVLLAFVSDLLGLQINGHDVESFLYALLQLLG